MKLVYGYSRVSTQRQADKGLSLEAQENQIKKYTETMLEPKGYQWAGLYRDAAHSGKKPLLQRPGGKELSMKVEPGDAVVFSRLDRGFRNLRDLLTTLDTWQGRQVSVHLLDLHCDTATPIGRLIISVIGSVAEFEQSWRMERIQLVRNDLKARGYWTGNFPPYGFQAIGERGRKRLYIDPQFRKIGAQLLAWRRAGWALEKIYWHLYKSGMRWKGKQIGIGQIRGWTQVEALYQEQEARGEAVTPMRGVYALGRNFQKKPTKLSGAAPSSPAAPAGHTP